MKAMTDPSDALKLADTSSSPEETAKLGNRLFEAATYCKDPTLKALLYTAFLALTTQASEIERLRGERDQQAPRPYPHWNGAGKVSEAFVFEGGSLTIKTSGHDPGGDGHFVFAEDDAEWEQDEESPKVYRIVNVANSELIFIRDKLNEVFPSAAEATVASQAVRIAELERERDEAARMLDRYDAPTTDNSDGSLLSIANRIEAKIYADAVKLSAPVAWRVKDFADGWIYCTSEDQAQRCGAHTGNLIEPLYLAAEAERDASKARIEALEKAARKLIKQCRAEFMTDGMWSNEGQLVTLRAVIDLEEALARTTLGAQKS
jgi:hypothetical protein